MFGIPELDQLLPVSDHSNTLTVGDLFDYSLDDIVLEEEIEKIATRPRNTLMEITAADACSGKSILIHLIAAIGCLPPTIGSIEIGGKGGFVAIFDADNRLDVAKLREVMRGCIEQRSRQTVQQKDDLNESTVAVEHQKSQKNESILSTDIIDRSIKEALSHILIFRPTSLRTLLSTLGQLPVHLERAALNHGIQGLQLSSIIIDSASAFYWQLRADQETRRVEGLDSRTSTSSKIDSSSYVKLIQTLQALSHQFECPVIASTWHMPTPVQYQDSQFNPTFPTAPSLRLEVGRRTVKRFPPGISVDQALKEKKIREEIVDKHEFEITAGQASISFNLVGGTVTFTDYTRN